MDPTIRRLQREAERIAARYPMPEFYMRFKAPMAVARKLFFTDPSVLRLRKRVQPILQENLGHGLYHCTRVSLDSAALVFVELESDGVSVERVERTMVISLMAGLLHDIRRHEDRHAEAGAVEAVRVLQDFPLTDDEVQCISMAIRNHEAFIAPVASKRSWFQLISNCLYDADKFRWGPDTFTHTLWHMVDHQGLTPEELVGRFPWGMTGMFRIIDTFRTPTGRQYGPEIIETGIEIGKEIYRYLLQHCKERAHDQ